MQEGQEEARGQLVGRRQETEEGALVTDNI